jgi:serine/threonine protein phosphatase PrpC
MNLQYEWLSFKGTLTKDNRDYCGIAECQNVGLYIVVDGATCGPRGGELAQCLTRRIVDSFCSFGEEITNTHICNFLREIHRELHREFCADTASYFIVAQKNDGTVLTSYAGDCRLGTIVENKGIEWLSQPHTLANAIKGLKDTELAAHPSRHLLTRSFGRRFEMPQQDQFPDLPNGSLIIATDGFWADLSEDEQKMFLEDSSAFGEGGRDDRSCLMLQKRSPTAIVESHNNIQNSENIYINKK